MHRYSVEEPFSSLKHAFAICGRWRLTATTPPAPGAAQILGSLPRLKVISVIIHLGARQSVAPVFCGEISCGRVRTVPLSPISWWICSQSVLRQSGLWLQAALLVQHQRCASGKQRQYGDKETAGHIKQDTFPRRLTGLRGAWY